MRYRYHPDDDDDADDNEDDQTTMTSATTRMRTNYLLPLLLLLLHRWQNCLHPRSDKPTSKRCEVFASAASPPVQGIEVLILD